MKSKTFENGLVVKHRKSAIIFEDENGHDGSGNIAVYDFTVDAFREFIDYIKTVAEIAWVNVIPKDATSEASDYWEYYDKQYDNNGYLYVTKDGIRVEAPYGSIDTMYQFNKPKVQSFIYDLQKKLQQREREI